MRVEQRHIRIGLGLGYRKIHDGMFFGNNQDDTRSGIRDDDHGDHPTRQISISIASS
jgi:hypothetical protein